MPRQFLVAVLPALAAAALSAGGAIAQVPVISERDCRSLFQRADANNDGVLTSGESTIYIAALKKQGRPAPSDESLSQDAFLEACLAGAFSEISLAPASPSDEKAADGLDEAQVRAVVEQGGYRDLRNLQRSADGRWQAEAVKDGESIRISIDRLGQISRL
jgi:hypothetical protein